MKKPPKSGLQAKTTIEQHHMDDIAGEGLRKRLEYEKTHPRPWLPEGIRSKA